MYNLNWTQAQEAMREGKRVKNRHFIGEEWFAFDGFHIVDEEGYYMDKWYKGYDWQDEGWMILDWVPQEIERQVKVTGSGVSLGEDYSALEERVIAFITGQEAKWFWLKTYCFSRSYLVECVRENIRDFG